MAIGGSSKILISYKAATVKLKLAISIAAVYLGNSMVLAAVVIVVKHKAYLLISQLIIGV